MTKRGLNIILQGALTAIILPIVAFCWGNYVQCRNQVVADNILLNQLFIEVANRHAGLRGAINGQSGKYEDRFKVVLAALDPTLSYSYHDYKEYSERELRYRIDEIVGRWHVTSKDVDSKSVDQLSGTLAPERCDIAKIETSPDIGQACETDFLLQYITCDTSGSCPDFRNWFSKAQLSNSTDDERATYLDQIGKIKDDVSGTVDSKGFKSDLSRVITALARSARDGQFFPKSLCLYHAVIPF